MILSFELSMPNVGAWNGRWSGENDYYGQICNFGKSQKALVKAQKILDIGNFHYDFGDGWSAGVTVTKVDAKEAGKLRRKSKGFCGYLWMIDSIKDHLVILNSTQRKER